MIRPVEVFVGLRYTRAKRRNHFISFISLISILGITLGIWALITVLSVMNGFEKELRARILGVAAHATVTGAEGRLRDWRAVGERLRAHPRVLAHAPYILGQAMLAHKGRVGGAFVRGILPAEERAVAELGAKMKAGRLEELERGAFGIVVGAELAWKLDLHVGAKVAVIAPQGQVTPAGLLPRIKRFTVVGIFEVGMYEYDSALSFVHLDDAALLYRTRGAVTGLRLRLDDVFQAPAVRRDLARLLGRGYRVRDWTLEHANFFRALRIEKTVMFVILFLIVAVAAFNIVSTLVMVVTDKRADIAILRTLGMSPASIMGVFMVQGAVIGVVGTLVGAVAGVLTAVNVETVVPAIENIFRIKFLAPDVYYISELPSDMRWSDVFLVTGASLGMGLLATLYPAWRAARTQPAEALRYE